jgi:hypothetical protein
VGRIVNDDTMEHPEVDLDANDDMATLCDGSREVVE